MLGVAASEASRDSILVAGVAGLVAGARSMAAGAFVSVQSQADAEQAALATERRELREHPRAEYDELAAIYVGRGLDAALAKQVVRQLMARDALSALSARRARAVGGSRGPAAAGGVRVGARFRQRLRAAAGGMLIAPAAQLSTAAVLASLASLAVLGGWAAGRPASAAPRLARASPASPSGARCRKAPLPRSARCSARRRERGRKKPTPLPGWAAGNKRTVMPAARTLP